MPIRSTATILCMFAALCSEGRLQAQRTHSTQEKQNAPQKRAQPSPPPIPLVQPTINTESKNPQPKENESNRKWNPFEGTKITDWLMVFTTVAYTIVSVFLLKAVKRQSVSMRRQTTLFRKSLVYARRNARAARISAEAAKKSADVAEDALRSTQAAEILLEGAGLYRADGQDPKQRFDVNAGVLIRMKNFGKTRGKSVQSDIHLNIPNTKEEAMPVIDLAPGDVCNVTFTSFSPWIAPHELAAIASGSKTLRFDGVVTYEDIFGRKWKTIVAGAFNPRDRGFLLEQNRTELQE